MANLIETLTNDMKDAMRSGDKQARGVLALLKSAIQNEKIELKRDLTEEEEVALVSRELKQNNEALAEFTKAGRQDLVDQTKEKIELISKYLPKQMTEEEIREVALTLGIKKGDNPGRSIGLVKKEVGTSAQGAVVKKVVEEIVS